MSVGEPAVDRMVFFQQNDSCLLHIAHRGGAWIMPKIPGMLRAGAKLWRRCHRTGLRKRLDGKKKHPPSIERTDGTRKVGSTGFRAIEKTQCRLSLVARRRKVKSFRFVKIVGRFRTLREVFPEMKFNIGSKQASRSLVNPLCIHEAKMVESGCRSFTQAILDEFSRASARCHYFREHDRKKEVSAMYKSGIASFQPSRCRLWVSAEFAKCGLESLSKSRNPI